MGEQVGVGVKAAYLLGSGRIRPRLGLRGTALPSACRLWRRCRGGPAPLPCSRLALLVDVGAPFSAPAGSRGLRARRLGGRGLRICSRVSPCLLSSVPGRVWPPCSRCLPSPLPRPPPTPMPPRACGAPYLGGSGTDRVSAIVQQPSNNDVVVAGFCTNSRDFPPRTGTGNDTARDAFLAVFTPGGLRARLPVHLRRHGRGHHQRRGPGRSEQMLAVGMTQTPNMPGFSTPVPHPGRTRGRVPGPVHQRRDARVDHVPGQRGLRHGLGSAGLRDGHLCHGLHQDSLARSWATRAHAGAAGRGSW